MQPRCPGSATPSTRAVPLWVLTYIWSLGHIGMVVLMEKLGRVVIYVLNFDNEFRRGFQRSVRVPVHSLSCEGVLSSLLPIQCLGCMDVPWFVINNKNDSCSFTWENVFNVSISRINIWVKLQKEKQTHLNKGAHISWMCLWNKNSAGNCYHFTVFNNCGFHQAIIYMQGHAVTTCTLHPGQCQPRPASCHTQGAAKPKISDLRKRIHQKTLIAGSLFTWSW